MRLQPIHNLKLFWAHLQRWQKAFAGTFFGFVVAYVVGLFWGDWLLKTGLPFLWDAVVAYARSPLGLWLPLTVIALSVLWAAINPPALVSTLRPRTTTPPPPPLSDRDRQLIQDIRVVWSYGTRASELLYRNLAGVRHWLRDKRYWGRAVLDPRAQSLVEASGRLDEALSNSNTSLADIHVLWDKFYNAYATALVWMAEIIEREHVDLAEATNPGDLELYISADSVFQAELEKLVLHPDHVGTIIHQIERAGFVAFARLRNGEPPFIRPTLGSTQAPNIAALPPSESAS